MDMARKKKEDGEASKGILNSLPPGMREELDSCDAEELKTHIEIGRASCRERVSSPV